MPGQQHVNRSSAADNGTAARTAAKLTRLVADALEDMKASDITALDIRHLTPLADSMFVASGRSDRHVRAIAEALVERCEQAGFRPLGIEGLDSGEWVLIDLADVIVHVMLPRTRDFYEIEKLWDISRPVGES